MMEKLLFWTVWNRNRRLLASDYGPKQAWEKVWEQYKDQDCIIRMQTIFAKTDEVADKEGHSESDAG